MSAVAMRFMDPPLARDMAPIDETVARGKNETDRANPLGVRPRRGVIERLEPQRCLRERRLRFLRLANRWSRHDHQDQPGQRRRTPEWVYPDP